MSEGSKAREFSFPVRRVIKKQLNLARFSLLGVEASLYSLVRNLLAREAEPASQCFPFVLMHGFAGFRELRIGPLELFDYFNGVRTLLGQMGYQVFAPEIAPFNPPLVRAQQWFHAIEGIRRETGAAKVHLVGHSQGGLDARVLVAPSGPAQDTPIGPLIGLGYAPHVASITTVSTPHLGTAIADRLDDVELVEREALEGLLDFLSIVTRFFRRKPQDALTAVRSMTEAYMREHFNRIIDDDPTVPCFAIAGDPESDNLVNPLMKPGYRELLRLAPEDGGGPNDGLVSLGSALFGNLPEAYSEAGGEKTALGGRPHWQTLGVVRADHIGEVGIPLQFPPNEYYDHLACFAGLAQFHDPAYLTEMKLERDGRWTRRLKPKPPRAVDQAS